MIQSLPSFVYSFWHCILFKKGNKIRQQIVKDTNFPRRHKSFTIYEEIYKWCNGVLLNECMSMED